MLQAQQQSKLPSCYRCSGLQCMVTTMSTSSATGNSKVQFALLKVVNHYLLIYYRVLE